MGHHIQLAHILRSVPMYDKHCVGCSMLLDRQVAISGPCNWAWREMQFYMRKPLNSPWCPLLLVASLIHCLDALVYFSSVLLLCTIVTFISLHDLGWCCYHQVDYSFI